MPNPPEDEPLFRDEVDRVISRMVVEGAPNKVIARATGLALGTIKWRLHRMYTRLGVHSRTPFAMAVRDLLESD